MTFGPALAREIAAVGSNGKDRIAGGDSRESSVDADKPLDSAGRWNPGILENCDGSNERG